MLLRIVHRSKTITLKLQKHSHWNFTWACIDLGFTLVRQCFFWQNKDIPTQKLNRNLYYKCKQSFIQFFLAVALNYCIDIVALGRKYKLLYYMLVIYLWNVCMLFGSWDGQSLGCRHAYSYIWRPLIGHQCWRQVEFCDFRGSYSCFIQCYKSGLTSEKCRACGPLTQSFLTLALNWDLFHRKVSNITEEYFL